MTTSPNRPPLLLHVGYHKTATTWMQRRLFTREHGYAQIAGHGEVDRLIVQPHGLAWDPGPARDLIARARVEVEPGLVPVISSELLSGHPFYGGRESDVLARRLREVAPEARILISIRAQLRILPSVYMQYLLRGGTMTPAEFFSGRTAVGFFAFSPLHFEYDRLVAHHQALFGRDRVHLLQQEALGADAQAAARALADFAGAERFERLSRAATKPDGSSYPEHAAPLLRRVNHLQRSVLNPHPILSLGITPHGLYRAVGGALRRPAVARLVGRRRPVSEHVARAFAGRYADSNRRLAEIYPGALDLSAYEVAPPATTQAPTAPVLA